MDPSISTISMKHQNVVGATVELIDEGLKGWKNWKKKEKEIQC